jgi:hypothetical protein
MKRLAFLLFLGLLPLAACRVPFDESHPLRSSGTYVASPLPAEIRGESARAGDLEVVVRRLDHEEAGRYLGPRARHTLERAIVLDVSLQSAGAEVDVPRDWIRLRRGDQGAAPLRPEQVLDLASLPGTLDPGTLYSRGSGTPLDIVAAVVTTAPLIDAYGAADYRKAAADVAAKATIPARVGRDPVRRVVVFPPLANPNLEVDAPELIFQVGEAMDSPTARIPLPPLPRP